MISHVFVSFYIIVSLTMEDMVIRSLSIFCFLLDDLMTLLWVFIMSWASFYRSKICVGHGHQVGGGCVVCGYPVVSVDSWLFSVSSSPCSTL